MNFWKVGQRFRGSTLNVNVPSAWFVSNWWWFDLSTSSIFHAIDAKTSYKLLLRRPWLYEHGIAISTLHQCLKYYQGRERKINGNVKPFTKAESHFVDARFLEEGDAPKEIMPSTITSTGRGSMKNVIQVSKEDVPKHRPHKEESQ